MEKFDLNKIDKSRRAAFAERVNNSQGGSPKKCHISEDEPKFHKLNLKWGFYQF